MRGKKKNPNKKIKVQDLKPKKDVKAGVSPNIPIISRKAGEDPPG